MYSTRRREPLVPPLTALTAVRPSARTLLLYRLFRISLMFLALTSAAVMLTLVLID